ncbi:hypothetical protein L6270_01040 [Candidatus Parcubacteria bacterium]|nr:hypothetical protein [Patescibacteria group bacterium]MBU4309731.1 hypothetical protein [Patescibacteria group bacterium]MBU4432117.1 hypothetical protein [Patescibacteria group bacterium]MBU4577881.1 hypothetical protein [Patescibacteria group bacterium]MCG2696608.1 hypothetical protein [Candidatus Parcubacteria bacterium]
MNFFKKISLFIFVFLFLGLMPVLAKADNNQKVEAPAILNADLASPHSRWGRPIVIGLAPKGSEVFVYIDGNFSGVAKINESKTETNNFYYQPIEPISAGEHVISTVAKNRTTKTLSGFSQNKVVVVTTLATPTVFKPNEDTITGNNKPLISGLTKSGTRVLIYIDGVYNGKTEVTTHESGTAGFVYKPFLHLGVGTHTYFAIAETKSGSKSAQSRAVSFNIEKKYPAPTLISIKVNQKLITGLAKNNSKVQIYLDKKLVGQFRVVNHKSGTANFAYTLQQPLTNGAHIVYAVSIDERGKESIWSNIKSFNVIPPAENNPVISKEAVSESAAETKSPSNAPVIENQDAALNEILSTSSTENKATQTSGLIDETKSNQGKLRMNVMVFVVFLVALMVWIFWVNRELIKEKRGKEDVEEKKSTDKIVEKK